MTVPVKMVENLLPDSVFNDFVQNVNEHNLEFCQQYPKRLFSTNKHQQWLLDVFGDFIETVAKPYCNAKTVQQIFLSYELPTSYFMLHRSHEALAGVVLYSLDNHGSNTLSCLNNSFDEPNDYLFSSGKYEKEEFVFRKNSALIVKNTEQRHHWGFNEPIPEPQVKRCVWIYLGKDD